MLLATSYNRSWADNLVAARLSGAKRFALGEPLEIPSLYRDVFTQLGLSLDCPYDQFVPVDETSHETEKYGTYSRNWVVNRSFPSPPCPCLSSIRRRPAGSWMKPSLKSKEFCLCFPAGTQKKFHQGLVPGALCGSHLLDGKEISAALLGSRS